MLQSHRVTATVFLLLLSALPTFSKQGDGTNLPPDSMLRIGVKHRPEECLTKSKTGDTLLVHYTGKLYADNKKFDSSHDRDEPFKFTLGQGQVIKGWDQGMIGMCLGEKRKLTVPSGKGYGDTGAGADIPPGATLVFEVELVDILEGYDDMGMHDAGMMMDDEGTWGL
mmetsp:Transcript_7458/g.9222  ORF Transcript_7458/g.9222 Transcript_7458/m.9222 type:complete len:168 (-) Transcript_7458:167-670(-)|eukprot:CAMPEP_0172491226 /NCGR_PEP_ID=MMETSP1066-20121228/21958_1 /TAXON_ID=671091 /ORGANISM="Coscinodiscus wailesii, Strain CCMP2513" /LENGTH=167 /DNA_ID=CAMNT_0013260165 /DNA_START=116 /DNA_END=619 /DNA_ORIENTATION=+